MIQATLEDKEIIVDILSNSFQDNKSVNYIVKQDKNRIARIRKLMEYAFDVCFMAGSVLLSDDKKGCALVLSPHAKKISWRNFLLDARLALQCCGLRNVSKVLKRESKIKALHPKHPYKHLWFIGVQPEEQNRGIGSSLLKYIISEDIPFYLETSTLKNLPWYKQHGFEVYSELNFGYTLYLLKKL